MRTLEQLGFQKIFVEMSGFGRRLLWYRPGKTGGTFTLFLQGFAQGPDSWCPFIEATYKKTDNHLVVFGLMGVGGDTFYAPGWVRQQTRTQEVLSFFRTLLSCTEAPGVTETPVNIVAHSLGCLFAKELAAKFPTHVGSLTLIAPPPEKWGSLNHWSFWRLAALTIPWTVFSIITGSGLLPPHDIFRRLFFQGADTAKAKELLGYMYPDSAIFFLSMVFLYRGGEMGRARKAGWGGDTRTFVPNEDRVFRFNDYHHTSVIQKMGGGHLILIHCSHFPWADLTDTELQSVFLH